MPDGGFYASDKKVNMVKYNNIGKSVLVLMLLVSPLAFAETEYPASDFQPKVLYSDESYQHAGSSEESSADSQYPAANFEPKVLYSDSEYKHKDTTPAAKSAKTSTVPSESSSAGEPSSDGTKKDEGFDLTLIVGLLVVALAGFYFVNNKKGAAAKPASKTSRSPARSNVGGGQGTGVANYLADKEGKATGVAKYLAGKEHDAPITGVTKYIAKQVVAARQVAAEKVTGVEKYLRSKG